MTTNNFNERFAMNTKISTTISLEPAPDSATKRSNISKVKDTLNNLLGKFTELERINTEIGTTRENVVWILTDNFILTPEPPKMIMSASNNEVIRGSVNLLRRIVGKPMTYTTRLLTPYCTLLVATVCVEVVGPLEAGTELPIFRVVVTFTAVTDDRQDIVGRTEYLCIPSNLEQE